MAVFSYGFSFSYFGQLKKHRHCKNAPFKRGVFILLFRLCRLFPMRGLDDNFTVFQFYQKLVGSGSANFFQVFPWNLQSARAIKNSKL